MKRELEPEILDHLPADDPRARQSRQDLRLINALMGNARFLAKPLARFLTGKKTARILELGSGDGTLMLAVARRVSATVKTPVTLWLLDQQNLVAPETIRQFQQLGWTVHILNLNLFDWIARPNADPYDAITCNLFIHHFPPEGIQTLFTSVSSRSNAFFAVETRRNSFCLLITKLLWFIGCNSVTRHDATVSVRAGFNDQELSHLWPKAGNFQLDENRVGLFTHFFSAFKRPAVPVNADSEAIDFNLLKSRGQALV